MASCCKENLITSFDHPKANIYVAIENKVQNSFEKDVKENLLYNWSKEDGDLYYSHGPEKVYGDIVNLTDGETVSNDFKVFSDNFIYLDYHKQYDIILFSDTNLACESLGTVTNFEFDNKFESIKECNETYVGYNQYPFKSKVVIEMSPISYIYVFQLIIYNDDKSIEMGVDAVEYMGLSGVAKKYDLSHFKPSDELGVIESFKVKNIQYYEDYGVVAERFVTFGLGEDNNSSWNIEDDNSEFGISLRMKDGTIKHGKANITKQLKNKPYGGVINIVIKNSDIVQPNEDTTLKIYVEDWEIHEIYIDF